MTFEDLKRVNEELNTIDVKGKEYVDVANRTKAFRQLFPMGTIETEMLSNDNGICIFKATVKVRELTNNIDVVLATGTAYERENSSFINKTSYIENCETSAVGRALGFLGIGIDTSIASAEEVQNAINNQTITQEEAEKYTLTFGKFKGYTIKEILEEKPDYIDWLLENSKDEIVKQAIKLTTGIVMPSEEEQTEKLTLLNELNTLMRDKGIDNETLLKHYQVKSNKELTIEQLKEAIGKCK